MERSVTESRQEGDATFVVGPEPSNPGYRPIAWGHAALSQVRVAFTSSLPGRLA
jgi:hypothetical protein